VGLVVTETGNDVVRPPGEVIFNVSSPDVPLLNA
jgi:hypothetical protein